MRVCLHSSRPKRRQEPTLLKKQHPQTINEGCLIPENDPLFQQYHDNEWGHPVSNDNRIFEKICLEGFQSGLSWKIILHRREHFRAVFSDFDMATVARYTDKEVNAALSNANIIRNARKIHSTINNAQRGLELQAEFGSLAQFIWRFEPKLDTRPATVTRQWLAENTRSAESIKLSKELKSRGWTFVGPTNMYALMQALGLVNDHTEHCPSRTSVELAREAFQRPSEGDA